MAATFRGTPAPINPMRGNDDARVFESSRIVGDMQFLVERAVFVLAIVGSRLQSLMVPRPAEATKSDTSGESYGAPLFNEINQRRERVLQMLNRIEAMLNDVEVG